MNVAGTMIVLLAKIERLLLRLGRKEQEFEALKGDMDSRIAGIRAEYAERLQGRADTISGLQKELKALCDGERDMLLAEDEKSADTLFGRVGWRKGRDGLTQDADQTAESIAQALLKRGYKDLVQVKHSPSVSAILNALKGGSIGQRALAAVGLRFAPAEEQWFYRVDDSAVRQYLTEHGESDES